MCGSKIDYYLSEEEEWYSAAAGYGRDDERRSDCVKKAIENRLKAQKLIESDYQKIFNHICQLEEMDSQLDDINERLDYIGYVLDSETEKTVRNDIQNKKSRIKSLLKEAYWLLDECEKKALA